MRVLITTGVYPPAIGGPAQYAFALAKELASRGDQVTVLSFSSFLSYPSIIRHLLFFCAVFRAARTVDRIITLDTFSVGFPSVLVGKILGIQTALRTGGDFLWEAFLERTKKKVLLSNFYQESADELSIKEKIQFYIIRWTLQNCTTLIFSTEWQRSIFAVPYALSGKKTHVIENFYAAHTAPLPSSKNIFFGPTRKIQFKNLDTLQEAFIRAQKINPQIELDIQTSPHEEMKQRLHDARAVILISLGDISPNLILDGLRAGKPFILTKENGITNRIASCGIFVDPLNIEEISNAIIAMTQVEVYQTFCKNIAELHYTHSWKEITDEILEALEEKTV